MMMRMLGSCGWVYLVTERSPWPRLMVQMTMMLPASPTMKVITCVMIMGTKFGLLFHGKSISSAFSMKMMDGLAEESPTQMNQSNPTLNNSVFMPTPKWPIKI